MMLLEHGASPNYSGRCGRVPIVEACKIAGQRGNIILKALLDKGAVVNRKYVTGLRLLT